MRIAVYQFAPSADIAKNHESIKEAIVQAAAQNVRLLVFQECAACGYPPVERANATDIDFELLDRQFDAVRVLAKAYGMYIALGTIRKKNGNCFNSIVLMNPDGGIAGHYDKRALWGWDTDNFMEEKELGIFTIDGIKIGFRICFEVRFLEYFRELFAENVPLCFVSFCDVSHMPAEQAAARYELIKAHLRTRAVENVMTVVSVNSAAEIQTAPTAFIDPNGLILSEAPQHEPHLLVHDFMPPEITFGMRGRLSYSEKLIGRKEIFAK